MDEAKALVEAAPKINQVRLQQFRESSFMLQLEQLVYRAAKNLIRNPTFTRVRLGQTILLAIFIAIVFWNKSGWARTEVRDKNGAMMFMSTAQFMLSIQTVILTCIFL